MARLARIVVPDAPHHVTQRGNRRQPVFSARMIVETLEARTGREFKRREPGPNARSSV